MKEKVLIITHSRDNFCVKRVMDALENKGAKVYRFNSDHYPVFIQLNFSIDSNGDEHRILKTPDYELDMAEITAVWYRRLKLGENLHQYIDQVYLNATLEESNTSFRGALDSTNVFQLDYYLKHRIAGNKFQQLILARKLGMKIPDTIVTNSLDSALEFYHNQREDIIVKMQSSFAIYDKQGNEQVVFTNKVKPSLLTDSDALQLCPMKFQENIKKKRELRVTVVSNRLFVAAIDSQKLNEARYDWRKEGATLIDDWYQWEIPDGLKLQILDLMEIYQLNYGAFDFIETPEGEFIFLEVNSGGEFAWLDDLFERQISEAIANTLIGKLPQKKDRFPQF